MGNGEAGSGGESIETNASYFDLLRDAVAFVDDSAILSGLVISVVVALVLVLVLRWPSLSLVTDLIMRIGTDEGVWDFSVVNNKWFISYDADEVYYFLYIPVSTLSQAGMGGTPESTKEFWQITKSGHVPWDPMDNVEDRFQHDIIGQLYYLVRGTVALNVFPRRRTHFLRVRGRFGEGMPKVYYWFSTRHGVVPRLLISKKPPFLKIHGGKFGDVAAGRIPQAVGQRRETDH